MSFVRHALLVLAMVLTLTGLLTTVHAQGGTLSYYVSLSFNGASTVGRYIVAATKIAEEDIVAQKLIPATISLKMVLVNDQCSGVHAMRGILDERNDPKASIAAVAIGGICSSVCRPLANYFGAMNIIFISAGCRTNELSDKDASVGYPYAARLLSPWKLLVKPFVGLLKRFDFRRVGLLAIESDLDWLQLQRQLKTAVEAQKNLPIKYFGAKMAPSTATYEITTDLIDTAKKALEGLKGNTYVIGLLLNDREVLATLLAAKQLGMLKNYVYIAFGYLPDMEGKMWPDKAEIVEVEKGLLSFNAMIPDVNRWKAFSDRVKAAVPTVEAQIRRSGANVDVTAAIQPNGELSFYAGLLYDSMMAWAKALDGSKVFDQLSIVADKQPFDSTALNKILSELLAQKFYGMTGSVHLTQAGDRRCNLSLGIIQDDSTYVELRTYVTLPNNTDQVEDKPAVNTVTWSGGREEIPKGYPEPCGFGDERCPPGITDTLEFQLGMAVASFVLLLAIILLSWWYCFYRRAKLQAEINAINAWIVNFDHILTNFEGKSIVDKKRISSQVRRVSFGSVTNKEQSFAKIGYYKGTVVCVKQIERESVSRLDPALFSELKEMRSVKHDNVNGFIGVCINAPNVCYLTVYCKHGSLQDIVQDEEFDLAAEFKISFAMDIAEGMDHLHESVLASHGRLTSSNCVIDNKWTCRITDYGMGNFRRRQHPPEMNEKYYSNKLWTAPELLRLPDNEVPLYGTPKGDVYSYSIILQELAVRDTPFSKLAVPMNYQDIVEMLKTPIEPPFRPFIPENAISAEWMALITSCWTEVPDDRPTFRKVLKSAKVLSGGQAINIVDNMMKKLEKNNEKLEELVAIRTEELNVEKKKVVSLLYNILPTTVAESLMRQGRVIPEAFDLVTLYFSDIVGFMKINQASTPYQVVALLNGIYSVFDSVTDKYDVYKCETIGDVYMVVSGLPIRNEERHATEIATMALHLLSSVASFKIPHMPNKLLQLRIGLHSGPVVTGVVGQKMPHYCLFGDTVNTASRMQSGGLALRIHSSSTCADLLMKNPDFTLDFRGEREVKGKGIMKTYWVVSKKGFNLPLPDLSLAASLEEHEFK